MIIENLWNKFYVPDEIWNDTSLSVADVFASAIPYNLYLKQIELSSLQKELQSLQDEPDEILVPNDNKNNIPEIEDKIEQIEKEILLLTNK
jgi:hypothetical protein